MKKKFWIVTELFHPDETAVAYIFTRIAEKLSKKYDVNVLAGPEFYDKDKISFSDNIKLNPNIKINRYGSLDINKNNLLQRTLNIILLSLKLANGIRKKVTKDDIILLATNPAPIILLAGFLKRIKKFELHILVHDVFPENTIPAGVFSSRRNIFYKFLKFIFDKSYSFADHLIVLGIDMQKMMEQKISNKTKCVISIIPNWSENSKIFPIGRKDSLISEWKLEGKIVIQYAGNIGRVQALLEFLDAFINCKNKNIHLVFCGAGALVPEIKKKIEENNLSNVSIFGAYSRDQQNEILNSSDISLVSLSKGMYGLGVPSKSYHILAAGKPILYIGDSGTEIFNLVKSENVGWAFDITKKEDLTSFLDSLNINHLDKYEEIGRRARKLSEEKYDEEVILDLFQKQIQYFN